MDYTFQTISSEHHDSIIIEHMNMYINKELEFFMQKQGTPFVRREALSLLT